MASGVYDIPKIETAAKSVVTNTTPIVAFRGAGRPEATAAIERAMDLFAAEIGMDPVEVRRKNLIANDAFPLRPRSSAPSTTPATTRRSLDLVLEARRLRRAAGRAGATARRGRRQATRHRRCRCTSRSRRVPRPGTNEWGKVEITPRRQGHDLLGLAVARPEPRHRVRDAGDRADRHPDGRHRPHAGRHRPRAQGLRHQRLEVAAGRRLRGVRERRPRSSTRPANSRPILLEASVDDVVLDKVAGAFHVQGTPAKAVSWAEVAQAAGAEGLSADDRRRAGRFVVPVRHPPRGGRGRHRDRQDHRGACASSPATTAARSSTRTSSKVSATAASRRASRRRCSRRSATTPTAIRSRRTSRTTASSRWPSCRATS